MQNKPPLKDNSKQKQIQQSPHNEIKIIKSKIVLYSLHNNRTEDHSGKLQVMVTMGRKEKNKDDKGSHSKHPPENFSLVHF